MSNSNPWLNKFLRRRFMRRHGAGCMFSGWLKHQCWGPIDPHHIHFIGTIRWDLWGNLLPVCRCAHDWIHGHRITGTVIAMAARIEGMRQEARDRVRYQWHVSLGRDAVNAAQVWRDQGRVRKEGDTAMLILKECF